MRNGIGDIQEFMRKPSYYKANWTVSASPKENSGAKFNLRFNG